MSWINSFGNVDNETAILKFRKADVYESVGNCIVQQSLQCKNVEEAEKLFREEIGQKLRPEKIHSVIGMDCSDDE